MNDLKRVFYHLHEKNHMQNHQWKLNINKRLHGFVYGSSLNVIKNKLPRWMSVLAYILFAPTDTITNAQYNDTRILDSIKYNTHIAQPKIALNQKNAKSVKSQTEFFSFTWSAAHNFG